MRKIVVYIATSADGFIARPRRRLNVPMKTAGYTLLFWALLCACTARTREESLVRFALSTPNHLSHWQQVRSTLQAEGIECSENASSLGTFSCSIPTHSFGRAKKIVGELISSNSLTVRVKKQNDSELFEVYEKGKKVAEESYIIK